MKNLTMVNEYSSSPLQVNPAFMRCLLFSFQGPSLARFFEKASCGSVGKEMHQAWAYSSVGLERTPDKREVGGSNPPRPTSISDSNHGFVGL